MLKMLVVFHWLQWCMALWLVNIILFARSVEASVNTQSFVPDLSRKTWVCVTRLLLRVHASEIGLRERLRTCNCACLSVHQLWSCLMCSHSDGKTVSFASQALFMGLLMDLNRCWNFLSSWYWELQTDKTWEQSKKKKALEMLLSRWLRGSIHADFKFAVLKSAFEFFPFCFFWIEHNSQTSTLLIFGFLTNLGVFWAH